MHEMFRSNGGCGYVKKPDFLMNVGPDGRVFDPKEKLSVKKSFKVKMYMGDGWHLDFKKTLFDSYSPTDFYTRASCPALDFDRFLCYASFTNKTKKTREDLQQVLKCHRFQQVTSFLCICLQISLCLQVTGFLGICVHVFNV